jgi:putative mRNA 3-end processing factor
MIIAPPSAGDESWKKKFGKTAEAFASGWMQIRGTRRRRGVERGFPLSDHADWDGILKTIDYTSAERVWVTHGYAEQVARWLQQKGINAGTISTRFREEDPEGD